MGTNVGEILYIYGIVMGSIAPRWPPPEPGIVVPMDVSVAEGPLLRGELERQQRWEAEDRELGPARAILGAFGLEV